MPGITIDKLMREALAHHQAGRRSEAARLYQQVLEQQPDHVDAMRLLGVIARQEGRLDEALSLLQKALVLDPAKPETHHNLGDALLEQGNFDRAAAEFSTAARLRPDWAEAHGALGNALREQGKFDEAIGAFHRAIALNPALAQGHLNLGRALHEQGKIAEGIAAYYQAILLRPAWTDAWNYLGNALWDQSKFEEALAAYMTADSHKAGYPPANWSAGKILLLQKRFEPAIRCFEKVVQFNPENARAHEHLARALVQAGRIEEACDSYREAIRLKPDSPMWQFKLASLSGDRSVMAAPPTYVKELFDGYASTFDQELVDALKYQAPAQMLEAVRAATSRRDLEMLDLGCGTGLCGQAFRPIARKLTGIDLSPEMIKRAEARNVYDHLSAGDALAALRTEPEKYDLIIAGDVLIYVGDLTDFMPAVAASLRPAGYFVFSIENFAGDGFFLHSEARFAHSRSYIRAHATDAGLIEISAREVSLRKQAGVDVVGWIILLQKT